MSSWSPIKLRTRRPKRFASSVVCEQPNTSECGEFAKCHAGYKIEAYVDFADPGGMKMASR